MLHTQTLAAERMPTTFVAKKVPKPVTTKGANQLLVGEEGIELLSTTMPLMFLYKSESMPLVKEIICNAWTLGTHCFTYWISAFSLNHSSTFAPSRTSWTCSCTRSSSYS